MPDFFEYYGPLAGTENSALRIYKLCCNNDYFNKWEKVEKFIRKHFGYGFEMEVGKRKITLYLENENDVDIYDIYEELNDHREKFDEGRVPKLEQMITKKLENTKFLVNSFIEHQGKHGIEQTKLFLKQFYFLIEK